MKIVALGKLFNVCSSKRVLKSQWKNEGIPFYRGREITRLSVDGFVNNDLFISEEDYTEYASKYGVPGPGDILVTAIGTIGNTYIVREEDKFYFKDASVLWLKKNALVSSEYINLWLKSSLFFNQLDRGNGATVDTLTINKLKNVQVALPPLPVQKRIVAILDEAFAGIDQAIANTERNLRNARELSDRLLDLAVQGNISERVNSDQSVEKLIAEVDDRRHKIATVSRKEKPVALPNCEDNCPPFDIPGAWRWVRLKELTLNISDGVHKKPNYKSNGIPFVMVNNLTAGPGISFEDVRYISREDHEEYIKRTHPEKGDILITKDGTIGVVRMIDTDVKFSLFVSVALIKPALLKTNSYLYLALSAPAIQNQIIPKGTALKHLYLADLRRLWIPFPPLAEQERIASRYELLVKNVSKLRNVYQQKLKALAELKQSILQKAFTGEFTDDLPL